MWLFGRCHVMWCDVWCGRMWCDAKWCDAMWSVVRSSDVMRCGCEMWWLGRWCDERGAPAMENAMQLRRAHVTALWLPELQSITLMTGKRSQNPKTTKYCLKHFFTIIAWIAFRFLYDSNTTLDLHVWISMIILWFGWCSMIFTYFSMKNLTAMFFSLILSRTQFKVLKKAMFFSQKNRLNSLSIIKIGEPNQK